jgi:photosystem I subunit III
MRRFFAVALVICLWFGIAAPASASIAGDNVSGLTPCGQNEAFLKRAATATTEQGQSSVSTSMVSSSLLCGRWSAPPGGRWRSGPRWGIPDS